MKSAFTKSLTAALALTLGTIPTGAPMAQNGNAGVVRLPPGSFNPSQAQKTIFIAPALAVGPASGPTGSQFQVQTSGVLGSNPAMVVFEAESYAPAPVRFTVYLQGSGNTFTAQVPTFLCRYGKRRWDIHVALTNRQALRNVGTFTPTNC